jgi:hypothetical protein
MPTFTVKDLTREAPRSPYETMDGIPWLARLIDKVRALKAGTLGEYSVYPCGGDRHFLGALGLDAEALKAEIDADKDDAAILAWVKAHLPADAEARIAAYGAQSRAPLSGEMVGWLEEAKKGLAAARPELDLSGVTTFGQLICVEEGHPLP